MKKKRDGVNEGKEEREAEEREVQAWGRGGRGYGRMPYPPKIVLYF